MEPFWQTFVGAVQDMRQRRGGERDAGEDPRGLGEELRGVEAHVGWVLFFPPFFFQRLSFSWRRNVPRVPSFYRRVWEDCCLVGVHA